MKAKNEPNSQWIKQFRKTLLKFVLKGDYKSALSVSKQALKAYPDNFVCRLQYAKLLGDWADELPLHRRKKYKAEAIQILRPLTRSLSGKSADQRFGVCLNYYYQSEAYQRMYQYGRRLQSRSDRNGFFAQGLGASLLAKKHYDTGNFTQSRRWAARSVQAWQGYRVHAENYYFAHYSFALALALQDESQKAMERLKAAARLSQRKVTDWEFADVLEIISRNQGAI